MADLDDEPISGSYDGHLLYHPYPVLVPESERPLDYFEQEEPWEREQVKAYMREHSPLPTKPKNTSLSLESSETTLGASDLSNAVHTRRPFVGELKEFSSPTDPETTFYIKRCGVRENITRRNLSSTVRYIQDEGSERLVTERDYPSGTLELQTLLLALADWNICDEQKNKVMITEENLQIWLAPQEYDFLVRKVFEVNPMWRGGGEEETKND